MTRYLLNKLKEDQQKATINMDGSRLDFGLIISRPPIFLSFSDREMQFERERHKIMKKYGIYPILNQNLTDMEKLDPLDNLNSTSSDNFSTHMIKNEDGTKYYSENSKWFKQISDQVFDNHSIQHDSCKRVYFICKNKTTNQWEFPSETVIEKDQTVQDTLHRLFHQLSDNQWNIHYNGIHPQIVVNRQLNTQESQISFNKKAKSVRTFFFSADHIQGVTKLYNFNKYSDYAWTSKHQINAFFEPELYHRFIHLLDLY